MTSPQNGFGTTSPYVSGPTSDKLFFLTNLSGWNLCSRLIFLHNVERMTMMDKNRNNKNRKCNKITIIIFGPTDPWEVGPIDLLPFVRSSVRSSVCYQLSSETNHRISLIFCIKLAFSKSKKVTKPDFRKKNYLAQIWAI